MLLHLNEETVKKPNLQSFIKMDCHNETVLIVTSTKTSYTQYY